MIRIFGHYVSTVYVWLGVLEFFVGACSLIAGYYFRFALFSDSPAALAHDLPSYAGIYALIVSVALFAVGMYQRGLPVTAGLVVRIAIALLLAAMLSSMVFYAFPDLFLGRGVMAFAMLFTLVGILSVRNMYFRIAGSEARNHRVLVLGGGRQAAMIEHLGTGGGSFTVVGYVPLQSDEEPLPSARHVRLEGSLLQTMIRLEADELVIAPDDRRCGMPVQEILDVKMSGIKVMDLLTFFEKETSRVKLDILHPSWIYFSEGFQFGGWAAYGKRMMDIVGAAILGIFSLPLMALVAAAVWLESGGRGPVLFHQTRVGMNGRPFMVHKFRSMSVDAEADGVARWAQKGDARITQVGRVIRKTRLDELPQLLNVLVGEMSLVGPRPERPEFVSRFESEIPFYAERHRVRPGLTGWAQLSYQYGSSDDDARHKLEYDLYYVKNASLFLDLIILLETVEVVLWGKGAH